MAWDTMLPPAPRGCEDFRPSPHGHPQRLPPGMELSAYRYHHGHHATAALNMVDFYQSCKSEYSGRISHQSRRALLLKIKIKAIACTDLSI